MPRNVRNFWIEAQVDGRKHDVATGPRRADGGIYLRVYIRDSGDVKHALTVTGDERGGKLYLAATIDGETHTIQTER